MSVPLQLVVAGWVTARGYATTPRSRSGRPGRPMPAAFDRHRPAAAARGRLRRLRARCLPGHPLRAGSRLRCTSRASGTSAPRRVRLAGLPATFLFGGCAPRPAAAGGFATATCRLGRAGQAGLPSVLPLARASPATGRRAELTFVRALVTRDGWSGGRPPERRAFSAPSAAGIPSDSCTLRVWRVRTSAVPLVGRLPPAAPHPSTAVPDRSSALRSGGAYHAGCRTPSRPSPARPPR